MINDNGIDIPHKIDDDRFRKNLERFYDAETVDIIMDARTKAHQDIDEGRITVASTYKYKR